MGTRLDAVEGSASLLGYSQSNGLTSVHQESLLDDQHEHPHELQEYFIQMGRQLNFNNESDKSIGHIEHIHTKTPDLESFDPHIFDSQY